MSLESSGALNQGTDSVPMASSPPNLASPVPGPRVQRTPNGADAELATSVSTVAHHQKVVSPRHVEGPIHTRNTPLSLREKSWVRRPEGSSDSHRQAIAMTSPAPPNGNDPTINSTLAPVLQSRQITLRQPSPSSAVRRHTNTRRSARSIGMGRLDAGFRGGPAAPPPASIPAFP